MNAAPTSTPGPTDDAGDEGVSFDAPLRSSVDGFPDDDALQPDADAPAWETERGAALAGSGLPGAVTEQQLARWIEALVDHDERALAALYDATFSRVFGLVQRIVRNTAMAEEVVDYTPHDNVAERLAKRFGAAIGQGAVKALREWPRIH